MDKQEDIVYLSEQELKDIMQAKLERAGLPSDLAEVVADNLVYADAHGIHSHGAIRLKDYYDRIKAGKTNINPTIKFEQNGVSTGILDGDHTVGSYAVTKGFEEAIRLAKENGVGVVGVKNMDHAGAIGYYLQKAALQGFIAITMCQAEPLVVPFGGAEIYYGTNPFGFAVPQKKGFPMVLDMATSVQAWGKVMDAKLKGEKIPLGWAVDKKGNPTTDPKKAYALLPAAGPKGSGLMMMIDILSGILLGLPFGKHVGKVTRKVPESSLGQFIIIINPECFIDPDVFVKNITKMIKEIHHIKPAPGFDKVMIPGEVANSHYLEYQKTGIPVIKKVYDYLIEE
jgi:ureidoglycolate dehydrogenase (NAD+)